MSFCPNCGAKLEDGAIFCGECGTRIDSFQESVNIVDDTIEVEQSINNETETMPWEQNVSDETEAMPWEQNVSDETETIVWEEPSSQSKEWESQNNPIRPSQRKKARQQNQQDSSITIKKPNINVNAYKAKAKKMSKRQKFVIAEVLCLALVIGVFCWIGSSKTSAQAVAKEYVAAYAKQDWSKIYDMTDFPEGTYLKKEQFIECITNKETVAIDNFEISEGFAYSEYASNSLLGSFASDSTSSSSGIQKFYDVQYTVKGQGSGYMSLEMIKQSEKSMLFFDTWKVASNDMVISNYYVSVPVGASATIDGIVLSESDKLEEQGYGVDQYSISIFEGPHTIQVSLPWFQIYENEFYAYEGDSFSVYDMELTEDGKLALQTKMQEVLEKFYQAAVAGKDFSEVSNLFMDDSLESAKSSYEYLQEELNSSDYYALNEVTFHDFNCEYYLNESGISAEMNYDYDMEYTYTWTSWRNDSKKSEVKTQDGYSYMNASFAYDGETYKLTSVNIRSVL